MHFDFEAILTLATLVTGVVWLVDLLFFAKQRRAAAEQAGHAPRDPIVVDYSKSFFPVILLVLVLRSFLAEPFHIPSSSMVPTLLEGDFILVNKFDYGIRLPVLRAKLIPVGAPKRGDVVVFHFPSETAAGFCMAAQGGCATEELQRSAGTDFIKRVVGLPGDDIVYRDKTLYINGVMMPRQALGAYTGPNASGAELSSEKFGGNEHQVLGVPNSWSREGEWKVPQ